MATDPRSSIKTYLESYITEANITLDDGSTLAQWIVMFGRPPEYIHEIIINENLSSSDSLSLRDPRLICSLPCILLYIG